ncbi:MAG: ATP-binding cassette domain-containing protein [Bacteroidales bacterium]|nr:ATP-binding cassette domain-containing protein [Bacteroidales bacterium]
MATKKINTLLKEYPFLADFFENHQIDVNQYGEHSIESYITSIDEEDREDFAIDREKMVSAMLSYIDQMMAFLDTKKDKGVQSLTVEAGSNKKKEPESFDSLTIYKSEIICIVGPTGSGKSRLLGDIEWVAQNDTPTNRKILINNDIPDKKWRFSSSDKLVAQLSQNMNFVMDLSVYEFIELHAQSRMVENEKELIEKIITEANHLAGEPFDRQTPVTSLSGGQSRALMIADTAILSSSPIILIDEIENAGIDRQRALELLVGEEKIVLMATHDPILALMGDKRIVIKNGGIDKIIATSEEEKGFLTELEAMDRTVQLMRKRLRNGEILTSLE